MANVRESAWVRLRHAAHQMDHRGDSRYPVGVPLQMEGTSLDAKSAEVKKNDATNLPHGSGDASLSRTIFTPWIREALPDSDDPPPTLPSLAGAEFRRTGEAD